MLADEREIKLRRNCREEEPHERVIVITVNCRKEKLGCFYASLAVVNLEFHVDLVLREKSLRCFIFAICVNNVSYERYVIFIT